jgi:hypothetical protein
LAFLLATYRLFLLRPEWWSVISIDFGPTAMRLH